MIVLFFLGPTVFFWLAKCGNMGLICCQILAYFCARSLLPLFMNCLVVSAMFVNVPSSFISKADNKLARLGRKCKACMVWGMYSYHLLIK